MKCREIAEHIEKLCPLHLACEWDNVGLIAGDADKEIKKVLLTLDVDEYVADEAIELGADMIITHHPVMFTPVNRLTEADHQQRMLRKICKNDICVYAAHTNMDCAGGGLNDYLAGLLELKGTEIFDKTHENAGFGRFAKLEAEVSLEDMIMRCKSRLKLDSVVCVGDPDKKISTVVVNSGSGSDCLDKCIEKGVDLLITGDLKYTVARKGYENGVAIIDAGHYGTEIIFTRLAEEYLKQKFTELDILISRKNVPVMKTY